MNATRKLGVAMTGNDKPEGRGESSRTRVNPSELRSRAVKLSEIASGVRGCREWLARIDVTLAYAEESGVTEFVLDGVTQLDRAKKLLSQFAPNVYRGVVQATIDSEEKA
jgi:hypothetical protein